MVRFASSFVITSEGFTDEVKLEQGSKLNKGANHLGEEHSRLREQ